MTHQKTARLMDACIWLSSLSVAQRSTVLVLAKQAASGSENNPEGAFMRELAFQYDRGNVTAPSEKKGEQSEWKGGEKEQTTKVSL